MNCKDFEKVVSDLVLGHLIMAAKKTDALAHKENCARCASLFSKEKYLTPLLQMTTKAETTSAPAHVKANLLKAFAEEQAKISRSVYAPAKSSNFFAWKWAAVAAVILIAVLSVTTLRLFRSEQKTEPQQAENPNTNIEKKNNVNSTNENVEKVVKQESPQRKVEKNKVDNIARRGKNVNTTPRRKSVEPLIENANNNEATTDFIALTYMDEKSAIDNGMIVRVQVPRATLIAMGLPLNAAQTDGYVKADVVIGDDGVARAIRLVQDSSSTSETKIKTN